MRTAVLLLSAAALVAPAMAIHEAVNDALPVGVTSNSVGVTERGTPDYGAAAPPPYAPESAASAAEPASTAVHKREDAPGDTPISAPDVPIPALPEVRKRADTPASAADTPVPAPDTPDVPVPALPVVRKRADTPVPAPDTPAVPTPDASIPELPAVRKRVDTPAAPDTPVLPAPDAPVPADVTPSHVVPTVTPPTPAVETPAAALTTTTTTTSATAAATHTAMKLARPATGNHAFKPVNHAAKPAAHPLNVARDGLLEGFNTAIKTARSLVAMRPATVKREIILEIRRTLEELAAMGMPHAAPAQDDALAAKKQYTGASDGEAVQLQGLNVDHEAQPLEAEGDSVPAAEEEEEPTYSANV